MKKTTRQITIDHDVNEWLKKNPQINASAEANKAYRRLMGGLDEREKVLEEVRRLKEERARIDRLLDSYRTTAENLEAEHTKAQRAFIKKMLDDMIADKSLREEDMRKRYEERFGKLSEEDWMRIKIQAGL